MPMSTATPPTAVEYVRALPPDDQEAVLQFLLTELIRINGGTGLIPFEADDGKSLGYYVPPAAAAELRERLIPPPSAEGDAQMAEALATPGRSVSFEEMKGWLPGADVAPTR
jgi:hypothetical protein